jgi:hypothetical protein
MVISGGGWDSGIASSGFAAATFWSVAWWSAILGCFLKNV